MRQTPDMHGIVISDLHSSIYHPRQGLHSLHVPERVAHAHLHSSKHLLTLELEHHCRLSPFDGSQLVVYLVARRSSV
jgi:hypothetical protein